MFSAYPKGSSSLQLRTKRLRSRSFDVQSQLDKTNETQNGLPLLSEFVESDRHSSHKEVTVTRMKEKQSRISNGHELQEPNILPHGSQKLLL